MKLHKDVYRNITLILQFGINMLVPIMLCTFLGIFLDRIFHTSFIVILLFFLGAFAGFRNIYIFAKSSTSETSYIGSDAKAKMDSVDSEGYDSSN